MNGVLRLDSEENAGTSFEIEFDRSQPPGFDQQNEPEVSIAVEPSGKKVLVIDDEARVLSSFVRMLSQCDVTTTSSEATALALLDEHEFDVIFCDIVMPMLSGPELAEKATSLKPDLKDKFILMSGGTPNINTIEEIADLPFLQKPFTPKDVYGILLQHENGGVALNAAVQKHS